MNHDLETNKKETQTLSPNFTFSLLCPHCQNTITAQDFNQSNFAVAHLQSYFQAKEQEYKSQLLLKLTADLSTFPAYQILKQENDNLKLIVEGYKLGTNKTSKVKGEELEKEIAEQLQATYNGSDTVTKITHVGEKADISQNIHQQEKMIGRIIYEIKKDAKWDPKWCDKLEKDMVNEQADFGILVATCRRGNPLWKPFPQKNILVSDDDNFIFASQIARLLILSRQRINIEESPQERIKKWEEWTKEKLPNYLLKLEKNFNEWEKDIGRINTSVKSMEKNKEEMKKVIIGEIDGELKSI